MNEIYEYRNAPGKGAIWLAGFSLVILLFAVLVADASHLMPLLWITGAMTLAWMIGPKPVYGIKVDSQHLVLSAWRNPRFVRLDDIACLRVSNVSEETKIAIVYKNEDEEGIFAADLPDIGTLVTVMAERGIPIRDAY